MNAKFAKGLVVGAVAAVMTLGASAAFAGTGIGAVLNLGRTNAVNVPTVLQGSTKGQQLRVVNTATATGATGIGIHTASGKPPLVVDSRTKVTNLDADLLDGRDSSSFISGGGSIVSARRDVGISASTIVAFAVPGFANVEATCELTGFGLVWRNATNPSTALDEWFATNGETRFIRQAVSNDSIPIAIDIKGDQLFTVEVSRPGHTVVTTTAGHWTPTGCTFDSQAVVQ
jgi:hypothetical protein